MVSFSAHNEVWFILCRLGAGLSSIADGIIITEKSGCGNHEKPCFSQEPARWVLCFLSDIDSVYNSQYIYHTARGLDFGKPIFYNNSITRLGAGKELAA